LPQAMMFTMEIRNARMLSTMNRIVQTVQKLVGSISYLEPNETKVAVS
jgi:hypothetical protein